MWKLATIGVALFLWWAAALWMASPVFPGPDAVARAFLTTVAGDRFWAHTAVSLRRIAVGVSVGVALGFALGVVAGSSQESDGVVRMVLSGVQSTPKAAVLPLLIVWCGIGELPKVVLIALASFVPLAACLAAGLRHSPDGPVVAAIASGMRSHEVLWYVRLPLALPVAFAGLRLGVGYAFLALTTAELLAASSGLGYLVYEASYSIDMATALAVVGTIAGLNMLAVRLVDGCEWAMVSWNRTR